jgi:hypothetical protein
VKIFRFFISLRNFMLWRSRRTSESSRIEAYRKKNKKTKLRRKNLKAQYKNCCCWCGWGERTWEMRENEKGKILLVKFYAPCNSIKTSSPFCVYFSLILIVFFGRVLVALGLFILFFQSFFFFFFGEHQIHKNSLRR